MSAANLPCQGKHLNSPLVTVVALRVRQDSQNTTERLRFFVTSHEKPQRWHVSRSHTLTNYHDIRKSVALLAITDTKRSFFVRNVSLVITSLLANVGPSIKSA